MGLLWGGRQGDDAGPAAWTRCGGGEEPGFRGEMAGQLRGSRPGPGARSRAPSSTPGRFQRLLPAERRIASRRKAGSCVPVPDSAPQKGDRQETSIPRGETCSPARVGVHTSIYTHTTHIDTRIDIHAPSYTCRYTQRYTQICTYTHTTQRYTHRYTHTLHTRIRTHYTQRYIRTHRYRQVHTGTHMSHTQMYTHTTHTDTHGYVHSIHREIHIHTDTDRYTQALTSHTHRCTHTQTHQHTHTYTLTTNTDTHHTQSCVHTQKQIHTQIHKYTHIGTYHADTHTRKPQALSLQPGLWVTPLECQNQVNQYHALDWGGGYFSDSELSAPGPITSPAPKSPLV